MPQSKGTLHWIKMRLLEPTTWTGFITLAAIAGLTISPDMAEAIFVFAASAIGFILVIRRERKVKEEYLVEE